MHWAKKAPITSNYRHACFYFTKQAIPADSIRVLKEEVVQGRKIALFVNFYKPDKRHRDDDNVMASGKAMIDGIAQAIGIDDKNFKYIPFVHDEIIKGGSVKVRLALMPIDKDF
jgi:hypothetical protein